MLIAQALGEYAALGAVVEAFSSASIQVEEIAGEWATEGLMLLIAVTAVWMIISRNSRM
jgi:hypothetical protein